MARQPIDRAAVRRVIREIQWLRSWPNRRLIGEMPGGFAFGIGTYDARTPEGISRHFDFEIQIVDGGLELSIDTYEASGRGALAQAREAWDVDEWEAGKFTVIAQPIGRKAYYLLAHIARTLLSGRSVTLKDGAVLPGITKVNALEAA